MTNKKTKTKKCYKCWEYLLQIKQLESEIRYFRWKYEMEKAHAEALGYDLYEASKVKNG